MGVSGYFIRWTTFTFHEQASTYLPINSECARISVYALDPNLESSTTHPNTLVQIFRSPSKMVIEIRLADSSFSSLSTFASFQPKDQ